MVIYAEKFPLNIKFDTIKEITCYTFPPVPPESSSPHPSRRAPMFVNMLIVASRLFGNHR
jgi:hypothetical protein